MIKPIDDVFENSENFEVAIIESGVSKFVVDFMSSNFGYDMTNETEEQRKYRIELIYSTIKAMANRSVEMRPKINP